jgi:hypothetical protein
MGKEYTITIKGDGKPGLEARRGLIPETVGEANTDKRRGPYNQGPFFIFSTTVGGPVDLPSALPYLPTLTDRYARGRNDLLIMQIRALSPGVEPDGSWTRLGTEWFLENPSAPPSEYEAQYHSLFWRRWTPGDPETFTISGFSPNSRDSATIHIIRNVAPDGEPFYSPTSATGTGSSTVTSSISVKSAEDMVIDFAVAHTLSTESRTFTRTQDSLYFTETTNFALFGEGLYHSMGTALTADTYGGRSISWGASRQFFTFSAGIRKADPMSAYPMPAYFYNPQPANFSGFVPPYRKGDVVVVFAVFGSTPRLDGWKFKKVGSLPQGDLYFGKWVVKTDFEELSLEYFNLPFLLPVVPFIFKNAFSAVQTVGTKIGTGSVATGSSGKLGNSQLVVDLLFFIQDTILGLENSPSNNTLDGYAFYYQPNAYFNAGCGWKIGGGSFQGSTIGLGSNSEWAVHTIKLIKNKIESQS